MRTDDAARQGAFTIFATIILAACTETRESTDVGVDISDVEGEVSVDVSGTDASGPDVAEDAGTSVDEGDTADVSDLGAPDTSEDTTDHDVTTEADIVDPTGDVGCIQELPECPPGDVRTATDLDGDGCPDACCFSECPTDFVPSDFNGDGCGDSCGDKPCAAASDCALYACAFTAGNCTTPKGICSNFACQDAGPVCGCDGVTYETGCVANQAGVPVATDGECPPP